MRVVAHNAKAPSAKGGLLATLSDLLGAPGAGAPSSRILILATMIAAACAPLLTATPASAATVHSFSTSFSSNKEPAGLAVDQSTNEVYVAGYHPGTVERFSASGTPDPAFAPSAFNYPFGLAVDQSTHDVYVAVYGAGTVEKLDSTGAPVAGFTPITAASIPSGHLGSVGFEPIAVALDQTTGEVFVADQAGGAANGVVDIFDSSGTFITQFLTNDVHINAVAVDSSNGDVYVSGATPSRFVPTAPDTYFESTPLQNAGSRGVAVDQSTHDVYLDSGESIAAYDSSLEFLESFGTGHLGGNSFGVAVNEATETVYAGLLGSSEVAVFATTPAFALAVATTGTGAGSVTCEGGACARAYAAGVTVTLTAEPAAPTVVFDGWTVNGSSSACAGTGPCKVEMSEAKSAEAEFTAIPQEALTVEGTGTGSGLVTGTAPTGFTPIECGSTCKAEYNQHAKITLTAHPAPRSRFIGWTVEGQPGACSGHGACEVEMTEAKLVNAEFEAIPYKALTVEKHGSGSGIITSQPSGVRCASTCSAEFEAGSTVTLTAHPIGGAEFSGWSGACSGTAGCEVTMGEDHSVTADFAFLSVPAEICPNEQLRIEDNSTALPDCRAYEVVTSAGKNGAVVGGGAATIAADGSSLDGFSGEAFAGITNAELASQASAVYRFARRASGWATTPLTSAALEGVSVSVDDSLWHPAQDTGVSHLFLGDVNGAKADIGPVWPPALGPQSGSPYNIVGAAADASHAALFTISRQSLLWPFDTSVLPEGGSSLYEYVGTAHTGEGADVPSLVGLDNAGHLIGQCGTSLGARNSAFRGSTYNAVSESGNSVFFTAQAEPLGLSSTPTAAWASTSTCTNGASTGTAPPTDELYARLGGSASVWVSEPQCTPASACDNVTTDPYATAAASKAAGVIFEGASADGSKVFFTTTQQLTNSDTDATRDLYEYDFDAPAGENLIRLSAGGSGDATPGSGAQVEGVSRISEDGSHVYFVAGGVLTTAPNGEGQSAQAGADNLYVYEPDSVNPGQYRTAFLADLCSAAEASGNLADAQCPANLNSEPWQNGSNHNDQHLWSHGVEGGDDHRPVQATPDGRFLLFTSYGDLTADDTSSASQVFRYDASTEALIRVSVGENGFHDNGNTALGDAAIVAPTYSENAPRGGQLERTMSDDGSYVFFQSPDALTPQALDDLAIDSQGDLAQNVYEYHDGHVFLISDGRDTSVQPHVSGQASGVHLIGTDPSGADVFFDTADPLSPQDTDTQTDIYDAHIGGGFPAPVEPPICQGEETCKPPVVQPPAEQGAASSTFSGPGNEKPKHKKHHKKKRHKKRHHLRADHSQAGAK